MGMFDSLYFRCIFCGVENEEQTKNGPSLLDDFHFDDDLPVWVMDTFNNVETACHKCGKKQKFIFDLEINIKRKEVIPVENLDYIELEAKKRGLTNLNKSDIIIEEEKNNDGN